MSTVTEQSPLAAAVLLLDQATFACTARGDAATHPLDDLTTWHVDAVALLVAADTLRAASQIPLPELLDLEPAPPEGDPLELVVAARDALEKVPDDLNNTALFLGRLRYATRLQPSGPTMSEFTVAELLAAAERDARQLLGRTEPEDGPRLTAAWPELLRVATVLLANAPQPNSIQPRMRQASDHQSALDAHVQGMLAEATAAPPLRLPLLYDSCARIIDTWYHAAGQASRAVHSPTPLSRAEGVDPWIRWLSGRGSRGRWRPWPTWPDAGWRRTASADWTWALATLDRSGS